MPRKKEVAAGLVLPDHDIFGNPLPEQDRKVLLTQPYRRKVLSGFVPFWNEFFRCYHRAGVSPLASYLWAYLRQYEYERPEWNAVSDISWPGRRDMADALGASMLHLPKLLNELRSAKLVSFQPVLPGFEDLAQATNSTVDDVRERAASVGVDPKSDATLYRTADPFTKSEFAMSTGLRFCKGCKVYNRCPGVKEAREKLAAGKGNFNEPAIAKPATEVVVRPLAGEIAAPSESRIVTVSPSRKKVKETVASRSNPVIETPILSSNGVKQEGLILSKNGVRSTEESETVTKKNQSPNLSRIKTNMISSPNNSSLTTTITPPEKKLVVVSPEPEEVKLLVNFGFDPGTAQKLFATAQEYHKPEGYLAEVIRYARENASKNPLGMARKIIEGGEERQSKARRWEQFRQGQMLLDAAFEEEVIPETELPVQVSPTLVNPPAPVVVPAISQAEEPWARAEHRQLRQVIAEAYGLEDGRVLQEWEAVLARLSTQTQATYFYPALGWLHRDGAEEFFVVVFRNQFDLRMGQRHIPLLQTALVAGPGKSPAVQCYSFT